MRKTRQTYQIECVARLQCVQHKREEKSEKKEEKRKEYTTEKRIYIYVRRYG